MATPGKNPVIDLTGDGEDDSEKGSTQANLLLSRASTPIKLPLFLSFGSGSSSQSSSKRKASGFERDDSSTPTKRRRADPFESTSMGVELSGSEEDCIMVPKPKSMATIDVQSFRPKNLRDGADGDISNEVIEIDLEDEEEGDVEVMFADLFDDIMGPPAEQELPKVLAKKSRFVPARNGPLQPSQLKIPALTIPGVIELRPGDTVELFDQDFLEIKTIIEMKQGSTPGKVVIRGLRLRRTHSMNGLLNAKLNELCYLCDVDLDDPRPIEEQSAVEVPLDQVLMQKKLVRTNQSRKARHGCWKELAPGRRGQQFIYEYGELFVRCTYVRTYESATQRIAQRPCEYSIVRLRKDECSESEGLSDNTLRNVFNSSIICGGSSEVVENYVRAQLGLALMRRARSLPGSNPSRRSSNALRDSIQEDLHIIEDNMRDLSVGASSSRAAAIDLTSERVQMKPNQKYTYGDAFSGAGGASRGAKQAGARLVYALDCWKTANDTYEQNFPTSTLHRMFIEDFIIHIDDMGSPNYYVDILHISPPCQFWSPAHTTPGKDDEKNMAALFAVIHMLRIVKPRIVTLEQTFGLKHHEAFLNTLVNMFTHLGYSIRWSIMQLADYGVPQSRKRLVIIAAAPGEPLPTFPPATHSKDGKNGLKKWVTINQAISGIPAGSRDHDLARVAFSQNDFKAPYDGNTLANCITTSGGVNNYHPSGRRNFTTRELACLQTFPLDHQFLGPYVKKQIGNAVPPKFAKVIFRHIIQQLEKRDGVVHQGVSVDD